MPPRCLCLVVLQAYLVHFERAGSALAGLLHVCQREREHDAVRQRRGRLLEDALHVRRVLPRIGAPNAGPRVPHLHTPPP